MCLGGYAQTECFEVYALVPGLLREEVCMCLHRGLNTERQAVWNEIREHIRGGLMC